MNITQPALLRVMEWSREEAKSDDDDLHKLVDRLSVFDNIDAELIEKVLK